MPDVLPAGEAVEKRLVKFCFWAPDCGVGWANWVEDVGAVMEKEL